MADIAGVAGVAEVAEGADAADAADAAGVAGVAGAAGVVVDEEHWMEQWPEEAEEPGRLAGLEGPMGNEPH